MCLLLSTLRSDALDATRCERRAMGSRTLSGASVAHRSDPATPKPAASAFRGAV